VPHPRRLVEYQAHNESRGNARLIAAAPDLLAALMTVTPAPHFGEPQMQAGFYAAARAAISRATGAA
jgi:hypothetical protein